jgi:hypothetical protein
LHAYGSETTDLQHFVTLSGLRRDEHGHRVPVLSLTHLTNLPRGTTVVWPPETPVTIGRMRPAWRRRDLRAQLKAEGLAAATLVTETEEHLAGAAAERLIAHTVVTPAAPRRWAVDAGGLAERVSDPADNTPNPSARVTLNGQVGGTPGGAGDDLH